MVVVVSGLLGGEELVVAAGVGGLDLGAVGGGGGFAMDGCLEIAATGSPSASLLAMGGVGGLGEIWGSVEKEGGSGEVEAETGVGERDLGLAVFGGGGFLMERGFLLTAVVGVLDVLTGDVTSLTAGDTTVGSCLVPSINGGGVS